MTVLMLRLLGGSLFVASLYSLFWHINGPVMLYPVIGYIAIGIARAVELLEIQRHVDDH